MSESRSTVSFFPVRTSPRQTNMEETQRKKQFGQSQTSGLVLMSENRDRRRDAGPSSEVESLLGSKDQRTLLKEMGSKVVFTKPSEDSSVKKKYGVFQLFLEIFFYFFYYF